MKFFLECLVFSSLLLFSMAAESREVPISDFFKDAEFTSVSISPDGEHMAVTVPREDRTVLAVLKVAGRNVVGKWDYGQDRHIRNVVWANNERILFNVTFQTGTFDYEVSKGDLYASNIDGSKRMDIPNGAYYSIVDLLRDDPSNILVERSIEKAYLSKLNIYTGNVITVSTAPVERGTFLVDHQGRPRFVTGEMSDGRNVTYRNDASQWTLIHESARNGASYEPIGFSADDRHVYMSKGEEGKPESIVLMDVDTREEKVVSANGTVDPSGFLWSSDEKTLLAVRYEDGVPYWDFISPEHPESKVYAGLIKAFPGKALSFLRPSLDGRYMAMRAYSDVSPSEIYLYDRQSGQAEYLAASRSWINADEMSPMRPVSVTTRDGLTIHGFLTVPRGSNGKNLPLIVNPHGGPHGPRDYWGFNPEVQLLANRGYAVLQMNYRGSGGYGNAFEGMGYRKWGTAMQDDLTDSVKWTVDQGIVDPGRVCIYGASYGGYAALMSAVREPDLYRCTVGYVGVYDLDIQFSSDIGDSKSGRNYLKDVYPETRAERLEQSPAYGVEHIRAGIMLVHGDKDVRVPIRNMNFLVDQLAKAGKKPDEIVVEKKEAHGFRNLDNNINLYTKMLGFFDKYIGTDAGGTTAVSAPK